MNDPRIENCLPHGKIVHSEDRQTYDKIDNLLKDQLERIAKLADERGYGQFAHDLRNLNSEAKWAPMTKGELSTRIQARIQRIPASNPSYISVGSNTLRDVLSRSLLERICDEAADVALSEAK